MRSVRKKNYSFKSSVVMLIVVVSGQFISLPCLSASCPTMQETKSVHQINCCHKNQAQTSVTQLKKICCEESKPSFQPMIGSFFNKSSIETSAFFSFIEENTFLPSLQKPSLSFYENFHFFSSGLRNIHPLRL